ncbi:DNA-binding transcriptional ArsR family regulator [Bradyrhizobium sp. USDA 4341]
MDNAVQDSLDDDRQARLGFIRAALDVVMVFDGEMQLACFRTLLKLCEVCESQSDGMPTLALANLLYDPSRKQRTNVTRHLVFLRDRGLVETGKDPRDSRVHLNRPTDLARELCRAISSLPDAIDKAAS